MLSKSSQSLGRIMKRTTAGLRASMLFLRMEGALRKRWEERQKQRYEEGSITHVADLKGKDDFCCRQAYYKVKDRRPVQLHAMKKLLTWYEGDVGEQQFKDMAVMAGAKLLPLKQKHMTELVTGTPDAGIEFMGEQDLIEVKTLHPMAFRKVTEAPFDYVQQLVTYLALYGFKQGQIWLKGKGADEWKQWTVKLEDYKEVARTMLQRAKTVGNALKTGRPPARYCKTIKDKKAKRCQFAAICFGRDGDIP